MPFHAQDGIVLAHIQELSAKMAPDAYTTSTQHVRWHPVPGITAEALGIPPSRDSLLAVWPASRSRQTSRGLSQTMTPLIHIPHCRLEMATAQGLPQTGKIERVALPGSTVRTLLSRMDLAAAETAARTVQHFDDADDWVHSRCILTDFSGLGEDEAQRLSEQGRLCCWASVALKRNNDGVEAQWDLCFVVHRVVARREVASVNCECF